MTGDPREDLRSLGARSQGGFDARVRPIAAGLAADRPDASMIRVDDRGRGSFYYATDTNVLYYSDGSTWTTVGGSGDIGKTTSIFRNTSQTPTQATDSIVTFANEYRDDFSGHSGSGSQLTLPFAGVYIVSWAAFFTGGTGTGYESGKVFQYTSASALREILAPNYTAVVNNSVSGSEIFIAPAANDYLELIVNVSAAGTGQSISFARLSATFLRT